MNNTVLDNLNKTFSEITEKYISICSKFGINKNAINNDELLQNDIMVLQVSMNDLTIQLQNLNFKMDILDDNDTKDTNNNKDTKDTRDTILKTYNVNDNTASDNLDPTTNQLIDKTMKEMLPLFLCALMNNDKDSILNNNTFMQNIKETMNLISNTTQTSLKCQSNSYTQPNMTTISRQTQAFSEKYVNNPDDLD
jgi:hypothetical protein